MWNTIRQEKLLLEVVTVPFLLIPISFFGQAVSGRFALLIHASFRPRLATAPLRLSSPSPPPGRAGDFHPLAVEHVRHTSNTGHLQRPAQGG
jgi:hypothetical protein